MMDANIENNELDQDEVAAAQQEQEQQQVIAAATKQRHLKIDSVLEKKGKFPLRNRKKIDGLIQEFLEKLGDDIHGMLFDNQYPDYDTYDGLDSDRDTEEELETAIRFFPEVLSRRKDVSPPSNPRHRLLHYPIQDLAISRDEDNSDWQCNVKSVSFVPIVARLAIEFGLFEEDERGGLLIVNEKSNNVLHYLMAADPIDDPIGPEAVDDKYLQVLIKLRQLDLLKKEDIQSYDLLHRLCIGENFPKKRFKMLVEWDPNALIRTDRFGQPPLNDAMHSSIQAFQIVLEYGIRYFPKKKGISLLFCESNHGETTFQHACVKFGCFFRYLYGRVMFVEDTELGCKKVMEVVEDTLARYSDTPVNVPEALLSAAIDENVHLDCVYFLLRREPDSLLKLLPRLLQSSSSSVSASGSPNDNADDNKSQNVKRQQQLRPRRRQRLTETFIIPPFAISAVSTGKSEPWNQIYKEACLFLSLSWLYRYFRYKRSQTGTALEQWTAIQRNYRKKKRGHVDETHYRVAQLIVVDFL
ncbi:hypothetical protein FRACYDRAFT_244076 [Fragilariopsis cylindrus CCMP1102]|uniref:Uncharacterized protein n=1 Tax=Fragilariopsis cylindrus CCMP1102 TaxID=635003 RepID=A0A1E7F3P0_9STRA|nr:hypothetical protein FRACYDRAFT_244076 [Fragilariopsis cylindrus CCMP1102]|eukprot:OEU12801.1 hypothetical protein FRACYDRAFT_244076 [Fragilariopsis cylindrus CCMP1102]